MQAVANKTATHALTCDRAGGWALQLPPGWFERWSNQHGREIMSYDPTGSYFNDGSYPEPNQIFIRLQMMQNPDHFTPAEFQSFLNRGGGRLVREQHQVAIAGQPAEAYTIWQSEIPPYAYLETRVDWYVRSPFFDDRMVVVTARSADSPLRSEAERLVASLRFFQPTAVNLIPTISKSEILARVSSRPGLVPTRIEAKLVLRKDLDATGQLGRDPLQRPGRSRLGYRVCGCRYPPNGFRWALHPGRGDGSAAARGVPFDRGYLPGGQPARHGSPGRLRHEVRLADLV
jgi:hypothetical protein